MYIYICIYIYIYIYCVCVCVCVCVRVGARGHVRARVGVRMRVRVGARERARVLCVDARIPSPIYVRLSADSATGWHCYVPPTRRCCERKGSKCRRRVRLRSAEMWM